MAEYIERSAVLAERTTMIEYDEGGWDAKVEVVRVEDIEAIPAAVVAPVVHCKECKHWHEETGWCNEHSHFIDSEGAFCKPWESMDWKMFDADYFCKDGERKEGDADVRPKEEADEG